ncbi:hypothetical protein HZ326_9750 [Fusarium oxysporum f. sp. albedinis]|nr:hypothetical protein HZ326_9750 [Fusarium oxysporum f. sp. albedinis]
MTCDDRITEMLFFRRITFFSFLLWTAWRLPGSRFLDRQGKVSPGKQGKYLDIKVPLVGQRQQCQSYSHLAWLGRK